MPDKKAPNGMPEHELEPLHEQRGNNPPRLIGYRCVGCKALLTPAGNWSQENRMIESNNSWEGRTVPNKSHARRRKAAGLFKTSDAHQRGQVDGEG